MSNPNQEVATPRGQHELLGGFDTVNWTTRERETDPRGGFWELMHPQPTSKSQLLRVTPPDNEKMLSEIEATLSPDFDHDPEKDRIEELRKTGISIRHVGNGEFEVIEEPWSGLATDLRDDGMPRLMPEAKIQEFVELVKGSGPVQLTNEELFGLKPLLDDKGRKILLVGYRYADTGTYQSAAFDTPKPVDPWVANGCVEIIDLPSDEKAWEWLKTGKAKLSPESSLINRADDWDQHKTAPRPKSYEPDELTYFGPPKPAPEFQIKKPKRKHAAEPGTQKLLNAIEVALGGAGRTNWFTAGPEIIMKNGVVVSEVETFTHIEYHADPEAKKPQDGYVVRTNKHGMQIETLGYATAYQWRKVTGWPEGLGG